MGSLSICLSTAGLKVELTEIQVFEVCVVVGYASYSDCNEISQVQLYLKMLRLKHSAPSRGGGLEASGLRHMGSCGRRLPSLEILSVGFWPPNWGPGGRLGVLLSTVDLNIPDIAVSSGDRNNQGKRPEVTLPL